MTTEDLAVDTANASTCEEDHFPRVSGIVGRNQETFVDLAGRKRPLGPDVFGIHGRFWDHIRDIEFIQSDPGRLLVRLQLSQGANVEQIQSVLECRLPMVQLDFECERERFRTPGSKRCYYVRVYEPGSSLEIASPARSVSPRPSSVD